MFPVAKHFDPVLGVDIHIIITPVGVPVPVPHPFIGFLIDPFDYAPIIGSTVLVNGLHRAIAGTAGVAMPPHIPIGGTFAKPPANECEMFMGSMTVEFDGDAVSYAYLPVLSCHDVGMICPPRMNPKKKSKVKSMVLPTSVVIPIPAGPPILIGGPPTISLMALAMRAVMGMVAKGLKRVAKSKAFSRARNKVKNLFKKATPSHNKACGRPGEPVDVVTGANVDEFHDYQLVGSPSLRFHRYYNSQWNSTLGPMGYGFRHEFERVLRRTPDGFEFIDQEGDVVGLPKVAVDEAVAHDGFVLHRMSGEVYDVKNPRGQWMRFQLKGLDEAPLHSMRSMGEEIRFAYDELGRQIGLANADGTRLRYELDDAGRIQRLCLRMERSGQETVVSTYTYDARGCLIGWQDALGHKAAFEYDGAHRMTRKVDRRGYAYHYRYDEAGRCIETYGDDGLYALKLEYFPAAMCTIATYADGARLTYLFNEEGVIVSVLDAVGGLTAFSMDDEGHVAEEIDPAGRKTTYLYDHTGAHTGRLDPTGAVFGPMHLDPQPADPLAVSWPQTPAEWEFGPLVDFQNLRPVPQNDPALETLGASSLNNLVALFSKQDDRPTESIRDLLGRRTAQRYADGSREEWEYDANGNVLRHRDRDGAESRFEYFSWNLVGSEINGVGAKTKYNYSVREEITRVEDATGAVSEFQYDGKDRLIEVRRHGVLRERYRYSPAGDLLEKVDTSGTSLITYGPGPFGLPSARQLASGEVQKLKYSDTGKIVEMASAAGSNKIGYDWYGRVISDVRDGKGVVHRWADIELPETGASAEVEETVVLKSFITRYRVVDDGFVLTDPTGREYRYWISEGGLVTRETASGVKELVQYDRAGRCRLKATVREGAASSLWQSTFHYTPQGDLARAEDSAAGKTTYAYDAAHRLVEELTPSGSRRRFRFDLANNLLEQPQLTGVELTEGNRLLRASDETFTYNGRNHIESRTRADGTKTTYLYDEMDRLIEVITTEPGNEVPTLTWSATYDPLGRRVSKTVNGRRVEYFWDNDRLAAELHEDQRLRVYIYSNVVSLVPTLFVEYDSPKADPSTGRVYTIFTNHIGAPVRVESSDGQTVWSAQLDPFGWANIDQEKISMPLRFPGHYFDEETGLHYNRYRYYDPRLGRYIQSDPWGIAGGLNLYAYSPNPLVEVDLDGLAHGKQANKAPGKRAGQPNVEAAKKVKGGIKKPPYDPHSGMTKSAFQGVSKVAQRNGVKIRMRPSNKDSIRWIKRGHPKKPEFIKNKTINKMDELMGPPPKKGTSGKVGHFKPPGKDEAVRRAEEKLGRKLTPDEAKALEKRRAQRAKEFKDSNKKLKDDPRVKVDKENGTLVDNRPGKTQGKEFTGDYDTFDIHKQKPDGSWERVTPENNPELHSKVSKEMADDPHVNSQHEDHMSWKKEPGDKKADEIDNAVKDGHRQGKDPLVDFNPDGTTSTSHYDG